MLTESIFNLAGIGRTLYEAITGRDYIVIQGFTLSIAVIYVMVNLVVDVSATASSIRGCGHDDRRLNAGRCHAPRPEGTGRSGDAQPAEAATRIERRSGATRCATSCASAPPCSGSLILGFLVFVAVFADVIATHDPNQTLLGHEAGVEATGAAVHPPARLSGRPAAAPLRASTATSATCSAAWSTGRGRR